MILVPLPSSSKNDLQSTLTDTRLLSVRRCTLLLVYRITIFSSHKYYRVQIGRFSALLPYGPELKRHRKLLQTYVNTIASLTWIETVEKVEARRLLVKILSEPSDFFHHLRTFVFIHIPFTLD